MKYRKQIVAMDATVDMSLTGEHVSPQKWKEMLQQRDDTTAAGTAASRAGRPDDRALPHRTGHRGHIHQVDDLVGDGSATKSKLLSTTGVPSASVVSRNSTR